MRHRILDGEFAANDPLPSESETVRAFDVSRVTVRQAIGLLFEEGLLGKTQGKGSFVKALAVEQNFLGLLEFRRDLRRQGHEPSAEILSYEKIVPPLGTSSALTIISMAALGLSVNIVTGGRVLAAGTLSFAALASISLLILLNVPLV